MVGGILRTRSRQGDLEKLKQVTCPLNLVMTKSLFPQYLFVSEWALGFMNTLPPFYTPLNINAPHSGELVQRTRSGPLRAVAGPSKVSLQDAAPCVCWLGAELRDSLGLASSSIPLLHGSVAPLYHILATDAFATSSQNNPMCIFALILYRRKLKLRDGNVSGRSLGYYFQGHMNLIPGSRARGRFILYSFMELPVSPCHFLHKRILRL